MNTTKLLVAMGTGLAIIAGCKIIGGRLIEKSLDKTPKQTCPKVDPRKPIYGGVRIK